MTKAITPGELLQHVLKEEDISARQLARRTHIPLTRINEMLLCKRGFEPATIEKLADAIPAYGTVWWRGMMLMAKAGRLFSDMKNKKEIVE